MFVLSCKQQLESRLDTDISKTEYLHVEGDYLGQVLPGSEPLLFAPGIVSNGLINRDITITPDGNEIYYSTSTPGYRYATIFCAKRVGNQWLKPEVVPFGRGADYITIEPCLNSDGTKLFFVSDRPVNDTSDRKNMNIWVVTRSDNSWNEPELLSPVINTDEGEFYPSITRSGTIYFTREEENRINYIYRSVFENNRYSEPEKLPEQVNCGVNRFNAYISPNENFIIIPAIGVEENIHGANYYISFRNDKDEWTEPLNMGEGINADLGRGWSASLSPDGKFLFFMSSRVLKNSTVPDKLTHNFFEELQTKPQNGNSDIYWVSASFLNDLKAKVNKVE